MTRAPSRRNPHSLILLAAVAVLLTPLATAFEEADAPALRPDVMRVSHEPARVLPGAQWSGLIEMRPGHNVTEVRYQVCQVGSVCFIPPTLARQVDETTWRFDTANGPAALASVDWQPGWRVGFQWVLTQTSVDGSQSSEFPQGMEIGTPACDADHLSCASTHYFTFEIADGAAGARSEPHVIVWGAVLALLAGIILAATGIHSRRRRRARAAAWKTAFALSAFLLVGGLAIGGSAAWRSLHEVRPAPAFTLTDTGLRDGVLGEPTEFSLSDYAGKTLVLDMMAVSCTACRVVADDILAPLQAEFGDRTDFAIVSIDTWADPNAVGGLRETGEELLRLQDEHGYSWRHALDTDDAYRKYTAIQLPKLIVVDGSGQIVFEGQGHPARSEVRDAVMASLEGRAQSVAVLQIGLYGMAMVAGLASIFSPCSVGLLPAYLGLLLRAETRATPETLGVRVRRSLGGGFATAGGIVALYAVFAGILWLAGPWLRPIIPYMGPAVAIGLLAIGLSTLAGADWSGISRRMGAGRVDGRHGFFTFGLGYGLAAFGCTGPAFLPILLAGFGEGAAPGLLVFLLYSASVAALVVMATLLMATGNQGRLRRILSHTRSVSRASAVLIAIAGASLLVYYGRSLWGW